MQKSIRERMVACLLVVCMLTSYLVTLSSLYSVSYASSAADEIVFDASFIKLETTDTGKEETPDNEKKKTESENSVDSDVKENGNETPAGDKESGSSEETKNDELNNYVLRLHIGIKEKGYLKNSRVEIVDYENQIFSFGDVQNALIQSFDNGIIKLNTVSQKEEYVIEIPLEIKRESEVNVNTVLKGTTINLSGIYVDEDAKEEKINIESVVYSKFENNRQINVGSNIENILNILKMKKSMQWCR